MKTPSSPPDLALILDAFGLDVRGLEILSIVSPSQDFPGAAAVHELKELRHADGIPQTLRADLGIVVGQLETMTRFEGMQLLSRLRDIHCTRVLLVYEGNEWSRDELLALGYLESKRPSGDGRCYLFDPDLFNQPRDWNNPSNWANPENFRKYRW
ncbi:MAG: hypothetical protein KAJ57_04480 [Woeseiaceae bacterium]|nr:hypothetical protein [Woeseiaceae bacterium]